MGNKKNTKSNQHLFHICFDSPVIFLKNMYFNYKGIDFKLIRGTKKYQDTLCCIIDIECSSGPNFDREVRRAEEIALRFLSCLSWELNIGITSTPHGGRGWRKEFGGLSSVKRGTCGLMPRMFRNLRARAIVKLPKIDDKYKARALNFFREAKASNALNYKFLCYWKILEIYNKIRGQKLASINWINNTIKQNQWILNRTHFNKELLENNTIGNYLKNACRHAIAHVKPDEKYELVPYSAESLYRIYVATNIVEILADIFIKKELGLEFTKEQKGNYLYLQKVKGKSIPVFTSAKS